MQQFGWSILQIKIMKNYVGGFVRQNLLILQSFGIIHVKYANDPAVIDKIPVHSHLRFVYRIRYNPMNTPTISLKPIIQNGIDHTMRLWDSRMHTLTHCYGIDVNVIKPKRSNIQHHRIEQQNVNSPRIMYGKYVPLPWFPIPQCHPTNLCWFLWTLPKFQKYGTARQFWILSWLYSQSFSLGLQTIIQVVRNFNFVCSRCHQNDLFCLAYITATQIPSWRVWYLSETMWCYKHGFFLGGFSHLCKNIKMIVGIETAIYKLV